MSFLLLFSRKLFFLFCYLFFNSYNGSSILQQRDRKRAFNGWNPHNSDCWRLHEGSSTHTSSPLEAGPNQMAQSRWVCWKIFQLFVNLSLSQNSWKFQLLFFHFILKFEIWNYSKMNLKIIHFSLQELPFLDRFQRQLHPKVSATSHDWGGSAGSFEVAQTKAPRLEVFSFKDFL